MAKAYNTLPSGLLLIHWLLPSEGCTIDASRPGITMNHILTDYRLKETILRNAQNG